MLGILALSLIVGAGLVLVLGGRRRGGQLLAFGLGVAALAPFIVGLAGPLLRVLAPLLLVAGGIAVLVVGVRGWLSFRAHKSKLEDAARRRGTSLKRRAEPWQ